MNRFVSPILVTALVAGLFQAHGMRGTASSDKSPAVLAGPARPLATANDKLKFVGQAETKAARDARMKWWREARFGMFIHWGLYAVPAGEYKGQRSARIGEWIMEWANIPRAEYEKFAPQFNPVKFDAKEWVGIAKNAGMKHIVITQRAARQWPGAPRA